MPQQSYISQGDTIYTLPIEAEKIKDLSTSELLKSGQVEELFDRFLTQSIDFLWKLAIAILIFYIGRWIIRLFTKPINRTIERRIHDTALRSFIMNLLHILLFAILLIVVINIIGTKTVSIAALIGSIGLALGLAVKDNLANFAGGVILLFNKPFKGGDYIEAQSEKGTVQSVGILYTTLLTFDNRTIHIPNGPLSTGNIINYSTQPTRRVELTVNLEYGLDVELVKKVMFDIAENHPLVLKDPAPFSRMVKMNDSSIDFVLRVWTKSSDFWTVTYDLNEQAYNALLEKELNIPFQQITVHMAKD